MFFWKETRHKPVKPAREGDEGKSKERRGNKGGSKFPNKKYLCVLSDFARNGEERVVSLSRRISKGMVSQFSAISALIWNFSAMEVFKLFFPLADDKVFSVFSVSSAPKRPLSDIDQELPLPLRERVGVRGNKKKIFNFHIVITPTLTSPIEGKEKNAPSGRELGYLFMVYGVPKGHEQLW